MALRRNRLAAAVSRLAVSRAQNNQLSRGCWRPLNGSVGCIGIDFLPYQASNSEVSNGTLLNVPMLIVAFLKC
jgi:hypothetical protein